MYTLINEIVLKSQELEPKLQSQLIDLETATISLPNKSKDISILDSIHQIQSINPKLTIIPYYSLRFHQAKTLDETAQKFLSLLEQLASIHISEVLLISGVPKSKYTTLDILSFIQSHYQDNYPRIAIAYNPFLLGKELGQENQLLQDKIKTALISSVYLQIGIDSDAIRKGVEYIRLLQPSTDIYISLMNPSPIRLTQFKYRPWKGVLLSEEYINSSQKAQEINQDLYDLAKKLNIGIIQGQ
jgi:hypothetical protein